MLTHTRQQHPVGQGFFHTGELQLGHARFRYVYDCGSENSLALLDRIRLYSEDDRWNKPLDALFISHLDQDHVNGLDRFLALIETNTVILPYLSDIDVFALAGAAAADGTVNATCVQFLADPVKWLGDRGVSRVVLFSGNESDIPDGPRPEFPDEPSLPESAEDIGLNIDDLAGTSDQQWDQESSLLGRSVQVFVLPHHVPLALKANGHLLNWGFISFVHPDFDRQKKFKEEVEEAFPELNLDGKKTSNDAYKVLVAILRDNEARSKLADCYLTIRKDRNLTSMSVYSGPFSMFPRFACSWSLLTTDERHSEENSEKCGWIGTGDANLQYQRRRNAFLRHYHDVLTFVQTMSLPHHGSRYNFSPALLEDGPPVFVASAGKSSRFDHPHDDVLLRIRANDKRYFITTEDEESTVLETIRVLPVEPVQREQTLYDSFFQGVRKHVEDPDLDLWLGMSTGDHKLVATAIEAGANVNITVGALWDRHFNVIKEYNDVFPAWLDLFLHRAGYRTNTRPQNEGDDARLGV